MNCTHGKNNHPTAHILVRRDPAAVACCGAWLFAEIAAHSISIRGYCAVALPDGSIPWRMYELLATPEWNTRIDWDKLHLFWCDERFVPPADSTSNYGNTVEALLSRVPLPETNIHRVPTEVASAHEAAQAYEEHIREFFKQAADPAPRFDLVLLGLGTDGHTASLFPYSPALHERSHLVVADFVDELNSWRISMTPPLLNQARAIAFLVTGVDKAQVLRDVLFGCHEPERLPAQLVRPCHGMLNWLVDEAAASALPRQTVENPSATP